MWTVLFCSTQFLCLAYICAIICVKLGSSLWVTEKTGCVGEDFSQANLWAVITFFSWNILAIISMTCFLMWEIRLHMYGHCKHVCRLRLLGRQNCCNTLPKVVWKSCNSYRPNTYIAWANCLLLTFLVHCVRFFILLLNIYSVPILKCPSPCINHSYK